MMLRYFHDIGCYFAENEIKKSSESHEMLSMRKKISKLTRNSGWSSEINSNKLCKILFFSEFSEQYQAVEVISHTGKKRLVVCKALTHLL